MCYTAVPMCNDKGPAARANFTAAMKSNDWRHVLTWESNIEDMFKSYPALDKRAEVLHTFSDAHGDAFMETKKERHLWCMIKYEKRRFSILNDMRQFWTRGKAMTELAERLDNNEIYTEAIKWWECARKIGVEHGFITLECLACTGIGQVGLLEGNRSEEAMDLLRNAVLAGRLNELNDTMYEIEPLRDLITQLRYVWEGVDVNTESAQHALDETGPLVERFLEVAADFWDKRVQLLSVQYAVSYFEARGEFDKSVDAIRELLHLVSTINNSIDGGDESIADANNLKNSIRKNVQNVLVVVQHFDVKGVRKDEDLRRALQDAL
jgi:hypothetical protein